jgi:tRNA G10  N-methylase Trm11
VEYFFGKITQFCDYEQIEKRDMEKPVRRQELAISPRLAKIMINLSEIKKGETLLDPFCGIGVILEEALLQGIKTIGIDKDKEAVSGAMKNMQWCGFKKENYTFINGNSEKIFPGKCNVIVTEPSLGDILKKIPTPKEAQDSLRDFESLIIKVLNNMKNNVSGKIVFTSPFIRTHRGRVSCDAEFILGKTGLKMSKIKGVDFPIEEFRENQIVGREIFVLEKN